MSWAWGTAYTFGFVPEEDLPALYRASDLLAIASACEVQSLPTLQAVATGLPVVAAEDIAQSSFRDAAPLPAAYEPAASITSSPSMRGRI